MQQLSEGADPRSTRAHGATRWICAAALVTAALMAQPAAAQTTHASKTAKAHPKTAAASAPAQPSDGLVEAPETASLNLCTAYTPGVGMSYQLFAVSPQNADQTAVAWQKLYAQPTQCAELSFQDLLAFHDALPGAPQWTEAGWNSDIPTYARNLRLPKASSTTTAGALASDFARAAASAKRNPEALLWAQAAVRLGADGASDQVAFLTARMAKEQEAANAAAALKAAQAAAAPLAAQIQERQDRDYAERCKKLALAARQREEEEAMRRQQEVATATSGLAVGIRSAAAQNPSPQFGAGVAQATAFNATPSGSAASTRPEEPETISADSRIRASKPKVVSQTGCAPAVTAAAGG